MSECVALLSDFGHLDHYVGVMKGVIQGIAPKAQIVDITHHIPAGDIRRAAFTLKVSYRYFPQGTTFVVVVDPSVGGSRKELLIKTEHYTFIGPDNGVLSLAIAEEKVLQVIQLDKREYFLTPVSLTFHGRDIFAPVAAHAARGIRPELLGTPINDYVKLSWLKPRIEGEQLFGIIMLVDHFGNLITNIYRQELRDWLQQCGLGPKSKDFPLAISIGHHMIHGLAHSYSDVPPQSPLAIIGSSDLLEIAVNGGNAAEILHCKPADLVLLGLNLH